MFLMLCLLAEIKPQIVRAAESVLLNPDLTEGAADSPDHWRSEAWREDFDFTTYSWNRRKGSPNELAISSTKPNDARWVQSLHLASGWYHFTAEIRTENVPKGITGANLSIVEDGIISADLHGTNDWQTVGFYLKIGAAGGDVLLACRLGGFAALNTGRTVCRNLKGVSSDPPSPNERFKYDLDIIRNGGTAPTSANSAIDNSTQVVAVVLLAAVVLVGVLAWPRLAVLVTQAMSSILSRQPRLPGQIASSVNAPRRKVEVALFCVSLATFAYFYQASDHNTAARFDLIRSLLERGTIWIDGYCGYNTADLVDWGSHYYSNKAPGGSLTGIVPWIVSLGITALFQIKTESVRWALVTYLSTVLSTSLLVSLMVVLIYRMALAFGASQKRSVALALILAFGTIMFPHATEFAGEPIAATCLLAALYLLFTNDGETGFWPYFGAGLLAGWAGLCDYPSILISAILAAYALWRLGWSRQFSWFALGSVLIAGLLFTYDWLAFGQPFFLSYEAYMLPGNTRFPAQAQGFSGVTFPRLEVLWQVLLGPQRGLFFCNPVLILAIAGLWFFWRRSALRAEFVVIFSSILAFVLLNASYGDSIIYWGGGTATGPRHMLPAIPFMVLALTFLPKKWNTALAGAALLSTFLMLMATAVEPHLPYEYTNPFRDFLWQAFARGDLAYNRNSYFGGPPIVGDSTAFNLGKIIGLPGWLQLLPLASLWIVCALYLKSVTDTDAQPNGTLRKVGIAFAIAMLFAPPLFTRLAQAAARPEEHGLLGFYYEGMEANKSAPHIIRVDKAIDFDDISSLGGLPYPSVVIWRGWIDVPGDGTYRFIILADDCGWLSIDRKTVIADPGQVTRFRSEGSALLTRGRHLIEVGQRNIWGSSSMKLGWVRPGGQKEVVPTELLIPEPVPTETR